MLLRQMTFACTKKCNSIHDYHHLSSRSRLQKCYLSQVMNFCSQLATVCVAYSFKLAEGFSSRTQDVMPYTALIATSGVNFLKDGRFQSHFPVINLSKRLFIC